MPNNLSSTLLICLPIFQLTRCAWRRFIKSTMIHPAAATVHPLAHRFVCIFSGCTQIGLVFSCLHAGLFCICSCIQVFFSYCLPTGLFLLFGCTQVFLYFSLARKLVLHFLACTLVRFSFCLHTGLFVSFACTQVPLYFLVAQKLVLYFLACTQVPCTQVPCILHLQTYFLVFAI